jgi:hypothetical protein
MTASNPIQIDGKTYDRYSLNLAITGSYKAADGSQDASIAMRLVPTRLVPASDESPASVETADSAAIGLLRGHLSEVADPAEQAAVAAIQTALQTLLASKGL